LVQKFGTPVTTPYVSITHFFPDPALLIQESVDDIAQIGLPKARAATILAIAQFVVDGGLNLPPGTTLDEVVIRLKTVRGIGEWTAQYIALRALRFPDAFPGGDLGLQKAAANREEQRLSEAQLLTRIAPCSPWRGYAALLLWQSLHKESKTT